MTRQIALGAVVAFFATVIALSVWEPKNVLAPAPVPQAVAPAPTVPAPPPVDNAMMKGAPFRPAMLKPPGLSHAIRAPVVIAQPLAPVDAGSP